MSARRESRRRNGASTAMSLLTLCLSLCTLASCTSTQEVYVSRRDARAAVHVVQRGETLTKIAWQHRVDAQELASWNGLHNPDELRVGQRLRLVPPRGYVAAAPAPASSAPTPQSNPPRASTTTRSSPSAAAPAARPPSSSTTRSSTSQPPAASAPAPIRWAWPTDGAVVSRFGADGSVGSGVGIAGHERQPVRAAAGGRVVYAGGGLIGYGQLVIIKHDEIFLSAYGYNAELLVTQGQDVARGATIALMGFGPNRQPRLHFEIRRNGVPVDPLLFVSAPR